jgi:exodeoxyribonuclease V alpha subunit
MTAVELDPYDAGQALGAAGLLGDFNRARILESADVHVASRLGALGGESRESVLLAAALAVRALRQGSVCVEVALASAATPADEVEPAVVAALEWPEPSAWMAALEASPIVAVGRDGDADRPLRLVDGLLYLDRYWRQEQVIAAAVDDAVARTEPVVDEARLQAALARLFTKPDSDLQRLAAVVAAHRWITVIAGGPGTGKTTTVARMLALLHDQPAGTLRVALAAPTALAAARLEQTAAAQAAELPQVDHDRLGALKATTLHRLLGWRPGSRSRFRHDSRNRLPYDVVVVDEASMVSLTMMSRLVEALRPTTRLILVGDPDQLASVEAGAVLGDLVHRARTEAGRTPADVGRAAADDLPEIDDDVRAAAIESGVVSLSQVYRFSDEIAALAAAVKTGDGREAISVLRRHPTVFEFVDADPAGGAGVGTLRDAAVDAGRALVEAARRGDAEGALEALGRHRLLCAHREGPYGVARWSRQVESWLADAVAGYGADGLWYVGRPLLVTANDYQAGLFNGDTGVVVDVGGRPRAAFRREGAVVSLPTSRLSDVQTLHAMSVHKSQGSQFRSVTVVLPPPDSPLLTRELFYTAITRAEAHVRLLGTAEAVMAAVERPIQRASGLRRRR